MKFILFVCILSLFGCEGEKGCKLALITEDCVRYHEPAAYGGVGERCSRKASPIYIIKKDGVLVYAKEFEKSEIESAKQDALKSLKEFCP